MIIIIIIITYAIDDNKLYIKLFLFLLNVIFYKYGISSNNHINSCKNIKIKNIFKHAIDGF